MTVFNGVDQGAIISGITAGNAIQVHILLSSDYSTNAERDQWDKVIDGRTTGAILVEHSTTASAIGKYGGMEVHVGASGDTTGLSNTNAKNGDTIELRATIGGNVGTGFSLFQKESGGECLPIHTSLIEIFNGDGTVKLHSFAMPDTISSLTINDSVGSASMSLVGFTVTPSGPTITGPDTTTEGAVTVQAGTLQDTITTQSLISGSYSIEQTIDSATATTLNYVAESGVNQCTPPTPVSGVPLAATISAAGITPYVVQQKADDGVNPPATRNITLNPEATHDVIQTMIAVANTNPDQSIFGTNIITVEDDMQAYVPKTANGMTITWADDGTFSTGMVDQTEIIDVAFFSPATGQWSCIALTIQNSSIVGSRSSFDFPNFQFLILDTTH